MKNLYVYFITITVASATIPKDICDTCVPSDKCSIFGNLSRNDQLLWMEKFPCGTQQNDQEVPPGFSATAIGDSVCCSNKIWGFAKAEQIAPSGSHESSNKLVKTNDQDYLNNNDKNVSNRDKIDISDTNTHNDNYIESTRQRNSTVWYPGRNQNYNNQNYWTTNNRENLEPNNPNKNNSRYWNDRPDREWNFGNQDNINNALQDKRKYGNEYDYRITRRPPFKNNQPWRPNQENNQTGWNQYNFSNNNLNRNPWYPSNNYNHDIPGNSAGQCEHLTSFPPDPQSGCCGREVADDDRITGGNAQQNVAPAHTHYWAQPPHHFSGEPSTYRNNMRKRAADGNTTTVRVENRITGGRETELYQYPWTVLLLTTFDYGNREAGFNCGGSLISTKYVLSAGHCVYDADAVVKSVALNLAEYDKRTFPRDCKVSQHGRKCIENVVIYAENIIVHPQYENENLVNDISLIRLQGSAPYTQYIRPICLPSINIDEPQFSNLQFEVAGWGRNGQYNSNVKQSTVLHLVNQNECRRSYPMLTTKHLCAAGYRGEDTCKGDSGGPLMTLYRGRYYASGLVSGKRADSPCGSAVPSLYTNVYHYLDWIRRTIRN